ncbi:MAG: phospholipase D-like domain-containing protein [Desulfobulbaceae bacterium]|nr:phospholipase D-like domain-containing protein [Desulfobulbaceae bacterium]
MFYIIFFLSVLLLVIGLYHACKKLPEGLSLESPEYYAGNVRFYRDLTWVDKLGTPHHDHQIFNEVLSLVKDARRIVLLDMFLYNNLRGAVESGYRELSGELTDALLTQKKKYPEINIILVTDPINTVYGGYVNPYFEQLRQAGICVVITDLDPLRDSNFLYSPFWRLFIRPFGNKKGGLLPNPFGPGRVPVSSYLRMFNFKADHRKVIIADQENNLKALVSSANPHDGSSSHGNVAVGFSGPAVGYLLRSEEAVIKFSDTISLPDFQPVYMEQELSRLGIKVLTESKIKQTILAELAKIDMGDQLVMVLFYLSARDVITALKKACSRGAVIKIVLDPNKDAFGRTKKGMPNRQVAAELVEEGITVRWGNTHGEQLHSKMMLVDYGEGKSSLLIGSANFTRRNLNDFNLETKVMVRGNREEEVFADARSYFELLWQNDSGREFTLDYAGYADNSKLRKFLYRVIEAIGVCTF